MNKIYTTYTEKDLSEAAAVTAGHAFTVSGACPDVRSLSCKLNLESGTSINVIATMDPGFSGTVTATVGGKACGAIRQTGTKYVIEIPNIHAHLLSHTFRITISTENGTLTLTGSGLSCAGAILNGANGNTAARNAAIAICRYSKAADTMKSSGQK